MSTGTLLLHPGTTVETLLDIIELSHGDAELSAERRAAVRAAARAAMRPTVHWAQVGGQHWLDGMSLRARLRGLDAAHAVLVAGGNPVLSASYAPPGALRADNSVRNGLKRAAALLGIIHPALGTEVASIVVAKGQLLYRPTGAIDIVAT